MLGFESLLERDYMLLLEFDDTVEKFEEQPVKIPFKKGVKPYVPDLLVHYSKSKKRHNPDLVEVKHTRDLEKNKEKYIPKHEQARQFAKSRNWDFKVVTEIEIRAEKLKTIKFLREYLHIEPDGNDVKKILKAFDDISGPIELDHLLESICASDTEKLYTIPTIWHLVVTGRLEIDFDQPITDKTLIFFPKV